MDVEEERYEGERRGLTLFLSELHTLVEDELGIDHILHRAIDRALVSESLTHLRHAKQLFNRLPRRLRLELSQRIVAHPGSEPEPAEIIRRYRRNEPTAFVSISSNEGAGQSDPWRIEPLARTLGCASATGIDKTGDTAEHSSQVPARHRRQA